MSLWEESAFQRKGTGQRFQHHLPIPDLTSGWARKTVWPGGDEGHVSADCDESNQAKKDRHLVRPVLRGVIEV